MICRAGNKNHEIFFCFYIVIFFILFLEREVKYLSKQLLEVQALEATPGRS